jgi:hypothetical protein
MRVTAWPLLALLFVALIGTAVSAVAGRPGAASAQQQPIVVQGDEVRNEFPAGITFALTFTAPSSPKEVRVIYTLAPDGTGATAVADCTGDATVTCTYSLTSGRGIVIIPGANITYHWDITGGGGDHLVTDNKLYVHEDTRFSFETLRRENVTLYYHTGSRDDAQSVLDEAVQTLHDIGALEETHVTFPVKVFLYETAAEMQRAIAPGNIGRGITVLGEVVYSDTAMVSADVDTLDITRHEVAHIVTERATKGPYGIASWLNEGISVYAQKHVLTSHQDALDAAIRLDDVLTMPQLNSSSAADTGATVGLFYGESGSIVRHLVDAHGAAKFAELLRTFRDGSTPGAAYEKVYGFDELGLENEWRQSVGLAPRPAASPTPASRAAPAGTPAASAAPLAGAGGGHGFSAFGVAIIAVLGVMLAGVGATTLATIRRRL